MVQRLARSPFKAKIRVRFPLALPLLQPNISSLLSGNSPPALQARVSPSLLQNIVVTVWLFGYSHWAMTTPHLELERDSGSNNDLLVTRLRGKLSLETVHDFMNTLRPEPATRLVLDMSGVPYMDSAGVGALVSLFVNRRNNQKSLALVGLTTQGTAVLQVSGLVKLLPIFASVEDAVSQPA
jgi:anti-anti-sigma factor